MRKKEFKTRIAAFALATAMACSAFATVPVVEVQAAQDVTNVVSQDTDVSEYVISDARGFKEFVNLVNNGNSFSGRVVKLANDIVFDGLPGNYTSILGFCGTFDGCGHSISGIYQTEGAGLFGRIGNAVIKNVVVKDSTFDIQDDSSYNYDYLGAIVGKAYGGTVQNCHVYNVTSRSNQIRYVGGVVGGQDSEACTIKNCTVVGGSITANGVSSVAGGIAGYVSYIYNCSSQVDLTGYAMWDSGEIGGVVGSVYKMQNCYSTGKLTVTRGYTGGIAGEASDVVANCYCLDTSAETSFGKVERPNDTNKVYTASYMSSDAFVTQLNANRGSNADWFLWEKRSDSVYPLPVKGISFANCVAVLATNTVAYNGSEQKPAVLVTYNGQSLVEGTDYTVIYANNINVGTGSVIVAGENMYMGATTLYFTITKGTPELSYTKSYNKTYGNDSFELNAFITNGADNPISYKSSSPKTVFVNEKYGNVTLMKPGKATISVILAETDNYFGKTFKITITVKPKKPSIYLSSKKRQLIMKWYRDANVTGYELQYSTDKSFKKSVKKVNIKKNKTIKKTVKGLKKGKKYYVRIRSYKTVSGKKIYSSWSSKKSIKIKK